jgi:hypothetical protein
VSCRIGPPSATDGTSRLVVLRIRLSLSWIHALGITSRRAPPDRVFEPLRVTALVTKPEARPNSAVMAPRLTENSWMSNSLTSVDR